MTRLLAWSADTTTGAANRHMWDQARVWAACSNPGDMNQVCFAEVGGGSSTRIDVVLQALMELGATVCTPKSPSCVSCPLQHICVAYKQQQEWEKKKNELAKSAAKGFFSSGPPAKSTSLPAGDDDHMCVPLARLPLPCAA